MMVRYLRIIELDNSLEANHEVCFFYFIGKCSYEIKTLRGMRTRSIGRALGAASLQADTFLFIRKLRKRNSFSISENNL